MKKIYATYRKKPLNDGSGMYTPSHFFNQMFGDYLAAGLTSILDTEIREDKYTGELVPGVPKLTRFLVGNYNDQYVSKEAFEQSLLTTGSEFHISIFETKEEAAQWIRDNTSLIEVEPFKFEIFDGDNPQGFQTDPIYLTIE